MYCCHRVSTQLRLYIYMYNTILGILFPSILGSCPNKHNLCSLTVCVTVRFIGKQVSPFLQATKALRERRGIALLCFYTSALEGGGWSASRPSHILPRKDPVPIVQEAGWAPGPVWRGAENLAPTGIRPPDRPARSQSLYRLSYRAHCVQ
jgi:hypothetical protein